MSCKNGLHLFVIAKGGDGKTYIPRPEAKCVCGQATFGNVKTATIRSVNPSDPRHAFNISKGVVVQETELHQSPLSSFLFYAIVVLFVASIVVGFVCKFILHAW